MTIAVTENAAKQTRDQMARRGKGMGLLVGVKKVGCSGLAYTFDYADDLQDGDRIFEVHDANVVVDVARRLLTYAFGAQVIDRIEVPSLKIRLEQAVLAQTALERCARMS